MTIINDAVNTEFVNENDLIGLFNAGHKKLVPILNDGKIPQMLTKGDITKIKKEHNRIQIQESYNDSWFTFIDDNPDFWTEDKLLDPYYRQKFNNVARVTSGDTSGRSVRRCWCSHQITDHKRKPADNLDELFWNQRTRVICSGAGYSYRKWICPCTCFKTYHFAKSEMETLK